MSNPTSVVTERRLGEFYQEILPYLGGSADAGFTPVGTIIMMSGNEAPANYLACDGTVYNISDYPELANFYKRSQGSANFYGGNGTTTFAVPDLKGEFLRGTGTNGHSGQGNGSAVGTHQNATEHTDVMAWDAKLLLTDSENKDLANADFHQGASRRLTINGTQSTVSNPNLGRYTSRPTNTSVLFCVATKDIYLNPSMDYSTSEKVVGKWIDGKTIYQKTIQTTAPATETIGTIAQKYISMGASIDKVISIKTVRQTGGYAWGEIPLTNPASTTTDTISGKTVVTSVSNLMMMAFVFDNNASTNSNSVRLTNNNTSWNDVPVYVTIQYTKTT